MRGAILKGGLAIFVISLMLTSISYAKIDAKTILASWLFDEGKGEVAKDSSGHGIDGKLIGDPKWVEGKFGKALEFDGNDYVDCGEPKELAFGKGDFSIALWMKTESTGTVQMLICLKAQPDWWTFYSRDAGTGWEFEVAGAPEIQGSSVQDKKWHHLTVVRSNGTVTLYKDGKEENSGQINLNLENPDVHIGTWDTKSQFYIGIIDEVVIFNVALTKDDIVDIMNGLERVLAVEPADKPTTTWGKIKAGN